MLNFFRRPFAAKSPPAKPARTGTAVPMSAPHRQRFAIEVAYFATPCEMTDCLSAPVAGRRVVLYGGDGLLPPALQDHPDSVVRTLADPFAAAVVAFAGLADGDTLTVLLPDDWSGPPAEAMLDHARRWFSSPHSGEDELRVG